MSVFKNVNVVSIPVTRWEESKKFYTELLEGWPVIWAGDEIGWMEFGKENETHIALNRWDHEPNRDNSVIPVFTVDDVAGTAAMLKEHGVRCEEVEVIPGMVAYCTFYDPEGNRLQMAGAPPAA